MKVSGKNLGNIFIDIPKIRNMEEFAAFSGVSRPTVSRFFHDPDSVRRVTREKLERALEQCDYRPNIFAINQNRKLTKNLGIVVPYLADPFFAEIARRIETLIIVAGFRPILLSSHGDLDSNKVFSNAFSNWLQEIWDIGVESAIDAYLQ